MDNLTELYCLIDDFCKTIEADCPTVLLGNGQVKRQRDASLSTAELITLVVLFHQIRYRQFKAFYLNHVKVWMRHDFPNLPSYNRCIEWLPRCIGALSLLFHALKGACTGVSIADATALAVCDNRRIRRHRVFKDTAERGKTSMGWFFGFKLHVIINHLGQLLNARLTPGNVDDRVPVPQMVKNIFGKLYADKGYIGQKFSQRLKDLGVDLITKVKRNMKPVQRSAFDQAVLNRRSLIETVFDELKNLCQIEHSRHRSPANFAVNLLGGLVAYCLMPNKPKLPLTRVRALKSSTKNALSNQVV